MGEIIIKFKFVLLLLVFGLILGIGCVSAADTNDVVVDNTLNVSNNSCYATNFKELSDFIQSHNVIELEKDINRQDGEKDITINKDVTIDGKGHTINANQKGRIFYVSGGTLTLNNLKLINGYANGGGAIESVSNLVCTNCYFSNNHAGGDGGAIYCYDLKLESCQFNNNYIYGNDNDGGAIYINGKGSEAIIINSSFKNNHAQRDGGAIYSNRDLTLQSCEFYKNYVSEYYGGAVYCQGVKCKSFNSKFTLNTANRRGGAIYGTSIIFNSTFDRNKADCEKGGAICAAFYVECTDCLFTSNSAYVDGGAIYSDKDKVTVTSCIFKSNIADGHPHSQCYGGAICAEDDVKCTNCNFTDNMAHDYGGAIYSHDNVIIDNSLFKNNKVIDDKGGAIFSEDNVACTNSIFINNHAKVDGGAINANGEVNIKSSNFTNNNVYGAKSNCFGGAICCHKEIECSNSIFENNTSEDFGGAIWCSNAKLISKSTFINNRANDDNGGAIYINNAGNTDVKDSKFINNYAKEHGGAIYCDSKNHHINIHHNIFIGNKEYTVYTKGYFSKIEYDYFGTSNPDFYGGVGMFVEWKHWPHDDIKHRDNTYFKTLEEYNAYGEGIDRIDIDNNSSSDNDNSKVSTSSSNTENNSIPMEHTGFPLIAILLAIFILPILRFRK